MSNSDPNGILLQVSNLTLPEGYTVLPGVVLGAPYTATTTALDRETFFSLYKTLQRSQQDGSLRFVWNDRFPDTLIDGLTAGEIVAERVATVIVSDPHPLTVRRLAADIGQSGGNGQRSMFAIADNEEWYLSLPIITTSSGAIRPRAVTVHWPTFPMNSTGSFTVKSIGLDGNEIEEVTGLSPFNHAGSDPPTQTEVEIPVEIQNSAAAYIMLLPALDGGTGYIGMIDIKYTE